MKHLFSLAIAFCLIITMTTSAFAHSQLEGSTPANGDVITEPLNEIVLEFNGQIEQGSFIDLTTTSGQAIEMKDLVIGEGTLTGIIAEPLSNDDYQVNWSIISADGHPLEGEFSFQVDVPVSENVNEETEGPIETTEAIEESSNVELTEQQDAAPQADDVDEKSSSSMSTILIVLLVVLIAGGLFFFMRRKKK